MKPCQKRRQGHLPTQAKKRQMFARVAARDEWMCWICGNEIDPDLPREHDEAGTLDHAVPFSGGGRFTLANLRLAHRVCNEFRGINMREAA